MVRKSPEASWLVRLFIVRIGGSVSGLATTYWLTQHSPTGSAPRLIGDSTALANAVEALVALFIGLGIIRRSPHLFSFTAIACGTTSALFAFAPRPDLIWVVRLSDGILAGIATTFALSTLIAGPGDTPSKARAVVAFESVFIMSFAVGSLVASQLWPHLSNRVFLIATALYIAALSLGQGASTPSAVNLGTRPTKRKFEPMVIGILALSTSASLWVSQITFVMTSHPVSGQIYPGSLSGSTTALLVVAYLAFLSLGLAIWAALLPKLNSALIPSYCAGAATLAPAALLASNLASVSPALRSAGLAAYCLLLLAQVGLIPSWLLATNQHSSQSEALGFSSRFVLVSALGSIAGPLLGGHIVSAASFTGMCLASSGLAALALAAALIGQRLAVPAHPPQETAA